MTRSRLQGGWSRRPQTVSGVAASLLLSALLSACVAPLADAGAFEHNAQQALDSGVSQTRTGALALENLLDHRIPWTYANTVVTESEKAMGPVQDSFGTVDPPSAADDRLRDDVDALLSDAADALAHSRIALRHDDRPAMARSVRELRTLADRMQHRSESLA